jgi:hypothetical protein
MEVLEEHEPLVLYGYFAALAGHHLIFEPGETKNVVVPKAGSPECP